MVGRSQWIAQAQQLNPKYSPDQLGTIYDDHIAENSGNSGNSDNGSGGTNPSDVAKSKWVDEAMALNPSTPRDQVESIYDNHIAGGNSPEAKALPKDASPSVPSADNQLDAIDKIQGHLSNQYTTDEGDPDEEPNGFDKSDKISMLGALLTSGKMGVEEALARVKQLSLKLGEQTGMTPKGELDNFTAQFNRKEARDKQFQEAMLQHPIIGQIGRIGGNILPAMALPMGAIGDAAEGGAALVGKAGLSAVKKIAPSLLGKAGDDIAAAATKAGASKIAQSIPKIANIAAQGATIGEGTYDPTAHNDTEQMITGALSSLALPGAGKLFSALKRPLGNELAAISAKYGIHLPAYPIMEKAMSYIPFSGISSAVKKTYGQVSDVGKKIAQDILDEGGVDDYGATLHGEVLKNYKANKALVNDIHTKIADLSSKTDDRVVLSKFKNTINDSLNNESALPKTIQDKKVLANVQKYNSLPATMDYKTANLVRQRLGDTYGQVVKAGRGGHVSPQIVGVYKRLYGSLKGDLTAYGEKAGGQIGELQQQADKIYQDKVLPFTRGKANKYLDKDYDTDQFIGDFLQPNKGNRASKLIGMLGDSPERGLASARAAVIHHAMEKADIPGAGFNPEKFVHEAMRLKKVNNIIFTPEQNGVLEGYQKLINITKNVSPKALDPSETHGGSLHVISQLFGGMSAIFHPHIVLPVLASAHVAGKMMTSDVGRRFLINLATKSKTELAKSSPSLIKKAMQIAMASIGAQAGTAGVGTKK